jgi:hypothetical protein
MPTSTQVAVVLDALVDAARVGIPAEQLVTVEDGQPSRINDPDVLVIGWSPNAPSAEFDQEPSDEGGGRSEDMVIACLASALRGESDEIGAREVRARCVELLDLLEAVLDADPTLGGVVQRAELGMRGALDQARTKKGLSASTEFTVLAETY